MKIALVATVEESVPPKKYGGTEWIVYHLAHLLGKKGHQVDLYAAADSNTQPYYNLIPIVDKSLRSVPMFAENMKIREAAKWMSLVKAAKLIQKKEYDIVHNHASWRFLTLAPLITCPIITTHHGPLNLDYQNFIFLNYKNLPHVSISNNQRKDLPQLNFVATVYNGIDIDMFPLSNAKDYDHMVFLARMSDEKGAIEAAQAAQKAEKKIVFGAKIDIVNKEYATKFKPYIDNKYINFRGEMNHEQRLDFLQKARCLLVPVKWEEPFGLMFIEAMACGTPVITFARGAAPEIIIDGRTGFLVNQSNEYRRGNWITKNTGVDGLVEAIKRIYSMPDEEYRKMRQQCRLHVEKNFTAEIMVNKYEKTYQRIIA